MTDYDQLLAASRLESDAYLGNIEFWKRAWKAVKEPCAQLPDLPYLSSIPARLAGCGAKNVLDLGCGGGWLSIYLARHNFSVTGVDVAEKALEFARQWSDREGLSVNFDLGDVTHLPYLPGSFDAVLANSMFDHLTKELAYTLVVRLKEILCPGGTLFACFDKVGGGPGEYCTLPDGTHGYADNTRRGMLLRYYSDTELMDLFSCWTIIECSTLESGSRILWARS